MNIFSYCLIFGLTYIYSVTAKVDIATCECVPFQSCKWSNETFALIQSTKEIQLKNLFRINICEPEKQQVWCCEDGKHPDNEEQLKELNDKLKSCNDNVSLVLH